MKKIIYVLGMHRSGTSCLTGLLEDIGFTSDCSQAWRPDNVKGNRESEIVNKINDEILGDYGYKWDNPPNNQITTINTSIKNKIDQYKNKISSNNELPVIKDPRLLLVLPVWKNNNEKLILIGIYRNPLNVAFSIATRLSGHSIKDGLKIWIKYNKILLDEYKKESFPVLCFDEKKEVFINKFIDAIKFIEENLNIKINSKLYSRIDFYSEKLVHHEGTNKIEEKLLDNEEIRLLKEAYCIYNLLRTASGLATININIENTSNSKNNWISNLNYADKLVKSGNAIDALKIYYEIININYNKAPIWRRVIELHKNSDDTKLLINAIKNAVIDCTEDPEFPLMLAEKTKNTEDIKNITNYYLESISRKPDWWISHFKYGQYLKSISKYSDALRELNIALDLNKNNAYIYINIASCKIHLGFISEAECYFIEACSKASSEEKANVLFYWANELQGIGLHSESITIREKLLHVDGIKKHMIDRYRKHLQSCGKS